MIKKFNEFKENLKEEFGKAGIIRFIKKYVTKTVALQSGFRDDNEDKFIKIDSYESGVHIYDEYITMLDKKGVLVQTFSDGEKMNPTEVKPYNMKYEELDVDILEEIRNLILKGDFVDVI